jgi:NADPH-dependent 2,4-dienoyl-CoA reductase/sulfur reductase-like enzyme
MSGTVKKGKKVLIVGGVAGGASCAARLRRLDGDAEIVIFERGEYVSYANCGLPYYIGEVISSRDSLLLLTPDEMSVKYDLDVRVPPSAFYRQGKKVYNVRKTILEKPTRRLRYTFLSLAPARQTGFPA